MADISIDSEHINTLIRESILESAIGKSLREAIDTKIKELGYSYNNPVKVAVDQVVSQIVRDVVSTEFRPAIEAKVKEALTDAVLEKVADTAWKSLIDKI